MILHLVRHGETSHNRDGLGLGRAEIPLTPRGEGQAAMLALRLETEPIQRLFCSPLGRARQTAGAIALARSIPVEVRDELVEMDIGDTDGVPFPVLRERFPDFFKRWATDDCVDLRMPGGESLLDIADRLESFIEELRGLSDPSVVVVSHNFVLKVLLCRLLGLDLRRFREIAVDLASITTLSVQEQRVRVRVLNDCCHLNALEP